MILHSGVNRLKDSSIKGYQKISSQNSLGRTTVKPVSSSLANAVMPKTKTNINGTAQINNRRLSEPIELNGKFVTIKYKVLRKMHGFF